MKNSKIWRLPIAFLVIPVPNLIVTKFGFHVQILAFLAGVEFIHIHIQVFIFIKQEPCWKSQWLTKAILFQ